jgi:FkbM family methyltransferase
MHVFVKAYGHLLFLTCTFLIRLIYKKPEANSFSPVKHSEMMKLSKISEKVFQAVVSVVSSQTRQVHTLLVSYNGKKMVIRPFIFIDILMVSGRWEIYVREILDKEIQKSDVVVDIGAGLGIYAVYLSDLAKKIIAFEPHPESFNLLETNIRLNNLRNVTLIKKAIVGLKKSYVDFNLANDPAYSGVGGASQYDKIERTIRLEAISLDEALSSEEQVDWMLIDVEGFETDVLAGARDVLRKHSPKIIYESFEYNYAKDAQILSDEGYSITSLGFDYYYATKN